MSPRGELRMMMRQRPLSACMRHLLCGGAALLLCSPLPAQTSAPASANAQDDTAKPDATKAKLLGNITATAISKMDIFVPGLVVGASQPTQPSYSLRGIGGSGFGAGTESAVGVYVDGVYAARTGGSLLAFNDIARIEVLKGPQGTLFL